MLPVFLNPLGSMKANLSPLPTRYARRASARPFTLAFMKPDELSVLSAGPFAAIELTAEGDDAVVDGALAAADAPANKPAHSFGGALTGAGAGVSFFSGCDACCGSCIEGVEFSFSMAGSPLFSLFDCGVSLGAGLGNAGSKGNAGMGAREGLVGVIVAVVEE
jgi:hypothetical protein